MVYHNSRQDFSFVVSTKLKLLSVILKTSFESVLICITSLKIGMKVNPLCSMVRWNWLRMVTSFNDFNSICFATTETRIKGRLPFFKLRDIVVL